MEILNVKVEDETMEKLEKLVKKKAYKNKSEAIRKILEEHFGHHPELFAHDELGDVLKKADLISDAKFAKIAAKVFRSTRTAAQIVAEGRER
jgi:Arc/MetJ-type ribon-helix-helix transcriptional regulator